MQKLISLLALGLIPFSLIGEPTKTEAPTKEKKAEAEKWKDSFFAKYPEADKNKDGKLTWYEFQQFKKENPDANAWIKK